MGELFLGQIVTITETLRQNDTGCLFSGSDSAMLRTKLGWLPINNIIRTSKLSLLHKSLMCVLQNIFKPMLRMSRVAIITTQEPQEEILSRLSPRKIQASEHFIPVALVC